MSHLNKKVISGDSEIHILQDVDLIVTEGESVAITGASGSGKTTLLALCAGLDMPTSGEVTIDKQCITRLDEEQRAILRAKYIGFIFQSFQLLPTLTALENVMLPLEIQYFSHEDAKTSALKWLDEVGLSHRKNHFPAKLSGGEQQRVAIARAFVTKPKIIFADEMTGNLDMKTGKLISDIVFSLNQSQGTTLVLVTHDQQLADRCHKKYQLAEGVLRAC